MQRQLPELLEGPKKQADDVCYPLMTAHQLKQQFQIFACCILDNIAKEGDFYVQLSGEKKPQISSDLCIIRDIIAPEPTT